MKNLLVFLNWLMPSHKGKRALRCRKGAGEHTEGLMFIRKAGGEVPNRRPAFPKRKSAKVAFYLKYRLWQGAHPQRLWRWWNKIVGPRSLTPAAIGTSIGAFFNKIHDTMEGMISASKAFKITK